MYTVRFNLGRGKNFMKWKVENTTTKEKVYLDPNEVSIEMNDCILKNRINQAMKIYSGENKSVCAWVLCKEVSIGPKKKIQTKQKQITYNPRVKPYWIEGRDNVDNKKYKLLTTINKNIYTS